MGCHAPETGENAWDYLVDSFGTTDDEQAALNRQQLADDRAYWATHELVRAPLAEAGLPGVGGWLKTVGAWLVGQAASAGIFTAVMHVASDAASSVDAATAYAPAVVAERFNAIAHAAGWTKRADTLAASGDAAGAWSIRAMAGRMYGYAWQAPTLVELRQGLAAGDARVAELEAAHAQAPTPTATPTPGAQAPTTPAAGSPFPVLPVVLGLGALLLFWGLL